MRKLRILLAVALLTFTVGTATTLLWLASHVRPAKVSRQPKPAALFRDAEMFPPEGWKKIEIEGRAELYIPEDMEPSEVRGESGSYRIAFSNPSIRIAVIYGDSDLCATPTYLTGRPTYHESVLEVDGRQAMLGVDRYYEPEYTIKYLCLPHVGGGSKQLNLSAICKDDLALRVAQQIFTSIRLK